MVHNIYRVVHNLYFHSKTPSGKLITERKVFYNFILQFKYEGLIHIKNILAIIHEALLHG